MKNRTLIIILIVTFVLSVLGLVLLLKGVTDSVESIDIDEIKREAVEEYHYELIPEEEREVIEAEEVELMPTIEQGTITFTEETFELYRDEVYREIIELDIFEADEILIEMTNSFDLGDLEKEVYELRRDLNVLMMLNEDEYDEDGVAEPENMIQQLKDPICFLIGYMTLDELDKQRLTIHPNALMFNKMDLDIVDIQEISIEELTDYYQMKSLVDFDDELIIKITIFSTLGETVNIFVDSIGNSTYLYTVESTVEATNHSILSEYIEKYK